MEKAALMRAHEEELVMALSRQMESHKHDKGFDDDDHRLAEGKRVAAPWIPPEYVSRVLWGGMIRHPVQSMESPTRPSPVSWTISVTDLTPRKINNSPRQLTNRDPRKSSDNHQHVKKAPRRSSNAPRVTSSTPRVTSNTPPVANNTPRVTNNTPRETSNTPRGTSNTPRGTSNTPRGTSNTPRVTSNTPRETSNTPRGTSNTPRGTSNTPRGTSNTPRGTSNTPRETSNTPRGTSNTPRETSNTPRGTSNTPRGTSNTPRGTSDRPEDSITSKIVPTNYQDCKGASKKKGFNTALEAVMSLVEKHNNEAKNMMASAGVAEIFHSAVDNKEGDEPSKGISSEEQQPQTVIPDVVASEDSFVSPDEGEVDTVTVTPPIVVSASNVVNKAKPKTVLDMPVGGHT
ncbi:conserved hypothetical protein [Perkinsus marinus ATCC 50983]|uniref:Uncharacterized protein n=1 Tax=Perkinsus marinus (strain ATCC 50983 / TXsc) TaxID=423536 RepID=C5KDZ2_PERM5|nr:conserved hypothetical protein [Perkinsus marinus ATCC 50983]EER17445.1 conserved hypothetical protein [Perkinsus marinus ATCC 50983]|eukprot:XP_002785649.1 conserved hypothetical protein [Perkinsus marinus ATCC 50983]